MKIGAIVLAGGRSRRMGQAKESLPMGDSTLLCRAVETLAEWAYPVVVVARDPKQELPPLPIEIDTVFDTTPDQGPLVGMLAGMRFVQGQCDAVYVTGCDVPFPDGKVIDWLAQQLGDCDVVMPKTDDKLQPLGALYRMTLLPTVEAMVEKGVRTPRSLVEDDVVPANKTRVLTEAEVDAYDPERKFLRSVNTPEEYEAAKKAAADGN